MAGKLGLDDLGAHFIDHAAMGLISGSNPFGVTLEQAISAGANASSTPRFNGGIEVDGAALGAGHEVHSVDTNNPMVVTSDTQSDGSGFTRPGFAFVTSSTADVHTKFLNSVFSELVSIRTDGNMWKENDSADRFIHEKMSSPTLTGTWTFTGTTSGSNMVHIGSTQPTNGERLWVQPDASFTGSANGIFWVDLLGDNGWKAVIWNE